MQDSSITPARSFFRSCSSWLSWQWIARRLPLMGTCLAALVAETPASAQEWEGRVTPYIWASGLDGDASVLPSLPSVKVNDDFADVIENLDIALMALVEADNGRLYVRSDLFFASLTADGSTPSDLFSGAKLNTETFNLSASAGIVAHQSETSQLNLFAGGRLWNLNNELTFLPGVAPGRSVEADRTFITPIVGTSGTISLSDTVTANASASLGGFGISGADIEIGVSAGLGVELSNSFGLTFGYRYLYLDYENEGFIYDLAQHGPLVGVQFRF